MMMMMMMLTTNITQLPEEIKRICLFIGDVLK